MLDLVKSYPEIVIGLISTCIGYFVAIVVSYAKFAQDLAYIRGQLSNLEALHEDFKLVERKMEAQEVTSMDHRARLKILETHVFKRESRQ